MAKKKMLRKEEIAEDWCFVCKDGGSLLLCDYGDCLKAYHPSCIGKEDSCLEDDCRYVCDSHFCCHCHKASKFKCFCCKTAVCGRCLCDNEFAVIKRNKGLCIHCAKLALLIEDNGNVDSDGVKIDFNDPETYECFFLEYYKVIKRKEGLNSQHIRYVHNILKGDKKSTRDLDLDYMGEGEGDSGESDEEIVSDYDDLNDTEGITPPRKKKCIGKLKSINGKQKDKNKEFIGWGSRNLIEFLGLIGKDTSMEYSEHEVNSFILDYCKEKKLFDPKKKKKVLCDAPLRTLLRRQSVNRNSIHNLLAHHFAENLEEMEFDVTNSSEERNDKESCKLSRQRKLISSTESHQDVVSEENQSFAAIVSSNLKLVYLKRSLVEELLKQPETFDCKVMGSFVRIKCDPYDYLQKNSHKLEQVLGINRSKNDEINKEISLKLSNVPKHIPICKVSDDDFTEEECKDLYQRVRNGLLKQPTVWELDQKARSLHKDIIEHWIPREVELLRNRIQRAHEKGWRRELQEYMDQKTKLEDPLEKSLLLSDIPKVIAEIVDTKSSLEGSPRKDNIEQDDLLELAKKETCNSVEHHSKHNGFARHLNDSTNVADGGILNASWNAKQSNMKKQSISVAIPIEARISDRRNTSVNVKQNTSINDKRNKSINGKQNTSINDKQNTSINGKQNTSISDVPVRELKVSNMSAADVIELSDNDDEQDANMADISAGRIRNVVENPADVIELSDNDDEQDANMADISAGRIRNVVENPAIPVWHCVTPCGERRGPFTMFALKQWSKMASFPVEFKVWKTGQSETEAIPLTDALHRIFPDM